MREATWLRGRYRVVAAYVALIVGLTGVLMLAPLTVALPWVGDVRGWAAYLVPGLACALAGALAWARLAPAEPSLTMREGGVVVVLGWMATCAVSAIPLALAEDLNATQAVFEAVSGWTTTGLSVLDVTQARPATLLWRSLMQLAGGAGFAIITLAAVTGAGGASLSAAEGRAEHLVPNVRASARLVLRIYALFVALGVVALRAAGMDWFDAVNHAFCALSTGGFSTRVESVGYWDSVPVEAVTIALMVLGSLNFATAWLLLRGRFRAVFRNGEIRLFAGAVLAAGALLLVTTCVPLYGWWPKGVRVAVFEATSALTTTGYSTVGYGSWHPLGFMIIIVLMLIGGATCSTAGGLKQLRVYLLGRALARELRQARGPRHLVLDDSIWEGEDRITVGDARVRTIATFAFLYLVTWAAGTSILVACGCELAPAQFEFASALGTVGLSIGITSAQASPTILWTETAGMFLGRLEFFVIFASAAKILRDSRVMLRARAEERAARREEVASP